MILFPNAKINLGLNILRRRPDTGYHDIDTVMLPIAWHDILEIVPAHGGETTLTCYGRPVDCPPEKNLVMKAYRALADVTGGLPPADIYLEKIVPDGAGLGGGSSDAAFTLIGLNEVFNLGFPPEKLAEVAALVGADCPFFIYNRPSHCTGTGTDISPDAAIDLSGYAILVAKPRGEGVSTKQAYAGVHPHQPETPLLQFLAEPICTWQGRVVNDFEESIFPLLPACAEFKNIMLDSGAVYASMSGSGSAVYGIFESDNLAQEAAARLPECDFNITPRRV